MLRILDDCCRAAVFYAQRMTANVDEARRARKRKLQKRRDAEDDIESSPKIFIGYERTSLKIIFTALVLCILIAFD